MKIKLLKSLMAAAALILIVNTGFSQKFTENFSGKNLYGWTFVNNTSPQPHQSNTWQFGGDPSEPAPVGYANGATILSWSQYYYQYAFVGYSKYDYDGANISNWFITPVIHNMKSGDELKFITTAQPDISTLDNLAAFTNMDVNALANCNRPNKLEIRLSMDISDSVNVGTTADSYGSFKVKLIAINDNLTLAGYPQKWTEYTVKIEGDGIPKNESFSGRIAFWYHFPNGGFNNCQTRLELPAAVDNLMGLYSDLPIVGDKIQYIKPILELGELAVGNQVGKNGTNIGLDDIQLIPKPGIFVSEQTWGSGKQRVWHANNMDIYNYSYMGYRGSLACSDPNYQYPKTKTFTIRNYSDAAVTVVAKIRGENNAPTIAVKSNIDTITIAAGKTAYMDVSLIETNYHINNEILLNKLDGTSLGLIRIAVRNDKFVTPITKCSKYIEYLTIPDDGSAVSVDAKIIDAGSMSVCGETSNLTYKISRKNGNNWDIMTTASCAELGENQVKLSVTDIHTGLSSSCEATLKVNIGKTPVFTTGHTQEHNLTLGNGNAFGISINAITPPAITLGCGNVTPEITNIKDQWGYYIGKPQSIPPGNYEVGWAATDKVGNTGYGKSSLKVIDKLVPSARCRMDTVSIGFTQQKYGQTWMKTEITSTDIDGAQMSWGKPYNLSWDNHKIQTYKLWSTWNGNTSWKDNITYGCSNSGEEFDVWMKVIDYSGNTDSCKAHVKIANPAQAECRDVAIDLDPSTKVGYITAGQLLKSGANGICDIKNASVSRYNFDCNDVNKIIPVTVSYKDATGKEHSCMANVTVNEYSDVAICQDTVDLNAGENYFTADFDFGPQLSSVCSEQLNWTLNVTGATNYNETNKGTIDVTLNPGFNYTTRTTKYLDSTYTCSQVFRVKDDAPPTVRQVRYIDNGDGSYTVDSIHWKDVLVKLPGLSECTYPYTIIQPFELANTSSWSYTLSGATTGSQTFTYNQYGDNYSEDKTVNLNPGITTITLTGYDLAGNSTSFSIKHDLFVQTPENPLVYSEKLQNTSVIKGDFCGENYYYKLESPFKPGCPNDKNPWMWYYEVRDGYMGNILYELDSIPRDSGAVIPIKIGPKFNQTYSRTIHLGYHHLSSGFKTLSTYPSVSARDTLVNEVICPADLSVDSNNDSTFTYAYTLNPPAGICKGAFWGYSISGATNTSTSKSGASYNTNQTTTLNGVNISDAYPTIPADSIPVIHLNLGTNSIKLRVLEESGNYNSYGACSYKVVVNDITTPNVICPSDDTLHRSSAESCTVKVGGACQQINGFTGAFGPSRIIQIHDNSEIKLDKTKAPASITFYSSKTVASGSDELLGIRFNCDGNVSFDWEYQSNDPKYFRPFILVNQYNPYAISQPYISGFSDINTGIQTGKFSQAVKEGDILLIGLTEGGVNPGHFRISNFSAPNSDISAEIAPPVFTHSPLLYLESNVKRTYDIGNHTIAYKVTNINNGKSVSCTQNLTVIDDFAASLACNDKTIHLNLDGIAVLPLQDVVNSCFPVSSTTMSKDTFKVADIGTQSVSVTSLSQSGQTLTCNFNVTVADTIKPRLRTSKLDIVLSYMDNTYQLSDSLLKSLFHDNHKIVSVSASKTSFSCNDVSTGSITVSATDSSGNIGQYTLVTNVSTMGTLTNTNTTTYTLCAGDSLILDPGVYGMTYNWQYRDPRQPYNQYAWNYYLGNDWVSLVKGASNYRFKRLHINEYHDYTFMSYTNAEGGVSFSQFDTILGKWKPAFSNYQRQGTQPQHYFMDFSNGYSWPYVVSLEGSNGQVKVSQYVNETWNEKQNQFHDNIDHKNLFYGDGFFFPVRYDGLIRAGKIDGNLWFDLYTPPSYTSGETTFISNAKTIVGARNSFNKNMFFELKLYSVDGSLIGKTDLSSDPTDNSALFSMHYFKNAAYVAYKSVNGKICVKKYDGNDSWSAVGTLDFSEKEIVKLDIGSVEDTLYVTYAEANNHLEVKKLIGGSWVGNGSPSDNISFSSVNSLEIFDFAGQETILKDGVNLIRKDGWKSTNASNVSQYTVNTSLPFEGEYRVFAFKAGCTTSTSGTYKVTVKENPSISVSDQQRVGPGTVSLNAKGDPGIINWVSDKFASFLLDTGAVIKSPYVDKDTTFYVYTNNSPCYSDTVPVNIFVNDEEIKDYTLTYRDSVCKDEWVTVQVDSTQVGFKYALYGKKVGSDFELVDGPYSSGLLEFSGSETRQYKVKVIEEIKDAAQFSIYMSKDLTEHHDYGKVSLPLTNTVTIESWVSTQMSSNPAELLCHVYSNGGIYDQGNKRNWEWTDGKFYIHNGGQTRELAFPTLPGGGWNHVATTAGPDGLKIYYNGQQVASSTQAAVANINTNAANLTIGLKINGIKGDDVMGVDEFRIWNSERSQSEISGTMNACLTGTEPGLILYNNYSDFNQSTRTFRSVTGNDAVLRNWFDESYFVPVMERNKTCGDTYLSSRFLDPFTIHVSNGGATITSTTDYTTVADSCGGEYVKLIASATSGSISWYDAEIGGNYLGTGDTLTVFMDKSRYVHPQPQSACNRGWMWVEVNEYPEVKSVSSVPICPGDYLVDAKISYDDNGYSNGVKFYDAPVGGNLLDIYDEDTRIYTADTIYAEAYNQLCVAKERVPHIISIQKVELTSISDDTTICGEGSATLNATGDGGLIEWWTMDWSLVFTGSTFDTPVLTDTTDYMVRVKGVCNSKFDTARVNVIKLDRYDTVFVCGSYIWENGDGKTYSNTDSTIVYYKPNATGCDSVFHLVLTVVDMNNLNATKGKSQMCPGESTSISIASTQSGFNYTIRDIDKDSVLFGPIAGNGGSLVYQTGSLNTSLVYKVIMDKSTTVGGNNIDCYKEVTDTIKVGQVNSLKYASSCLNYTWNDSTYTTSGIYSKTFTSVNGCDSVVTLNLIILKTSNYVETITACNSYTWHDSTYTQSTNTPTWSGTSPWGCDSTVTLNLTINYNSSSGVTVTSCNSYIWFGNTYSKSGIYKRTEKSSNGCDSVVTLNLTINQSSGSKETISACNSYIWRGQTYTGSGVYTDTLKTVSGCDSILTLDLTIRKATTGTDKITACSSYTWVDGVTYTSSNSTATKTYTNAAGCDSTVTLNLTINSATTGTDVVKACDSYKWIDDITYATSNNTATHTLKNANGCDSVVTLNLTINQPTAGTDTITVCGSYKWIDGVTYTSSNSTASKTFTNAAGCDSVVTLNLTISSDTGKVEIVQSYDTLTASVSGAVYQWIDCNNGNAVISNATGQSYLASDGGSYAVTVSRNGCSTTSTCQTVIVTDLSKTTFTKIFQIFPNPNQGIFLIRSNEEGDLTIVNLLGEVVYSGKVNPGVQRINLEEKSNGVYFVKFKSEKQNTSFKMVIQK